MLTLRCIGSQSYQLNYSGRIEVWHVMSRDHVPRPLLWVEKLNSSRYYAGKDPDWTPTEEENEEEEREENARLGGGRRQNIKTVAQ